MFGILVLLFTIVPAIEIYLLIKIGSQLGGLNTISIVILTGIVGAALAKSQGLAIINKIQHDLTRGSLPADQIIHGLLVFGGGLLLLTPGFLTDIFGLCMVIPGTRHLLVQLMKTQFQKGIQNGNIFFSSNMGQFKSNGFNSNGYSHSSNSFDYNSHEPDQTLGDVIEVDFVEKKTRKD